MNRSKHILFAALLACVACQSDTETIVDPDPEHGEIAQGIMAPLGQPLPSANAEQLLTFQKGLEATQHRFTIEEGLGPAFNVTFCGACHEKPVFGGSAGTYRNFFIAGNKEEDQAFRIANGVSLFDCGDESVPPENRTVNPPPESESGAVEGVLRFYNYGENNDSFPDDYLEPGALPLNVIAQRNPIPFFGVGLLAEIDSEEILSRVDEKDSDGDGISGRANVVDGFVGRFGLKAQTSSIEGFIRGPLFNHLGITTDPLSESQKAALPVDSSTPEEDMAALSFSKKMLAYGQAAAPSGPNCDLDGAVDPEMSTDTLFDLVSYSMLLAAPPIEETTEELRKGMTEFNLAGCGDCHTPRLESPRGPLPVYSDLLLHDMGEALDDGFPFGEATGSEFRTQPLWGLSAAGPYLHDGRAYTIDEAIRFHGGEAERSKNNYEALTVQKQALLTEFLLSLGGRDQASLGLVPPGDSMPALGEYGGPSRALNATEEKLFRDSLIEFDKERGLSEGLGAPTLNGDSCRACHFEPVIGGAGPRGVNVIRHGKINAGVFSAPASGTILHKTSSNLTAINVPEDGTTIYEHRQTPHLFGAGLIDSVPENALVALQDPTDADNDGVSGRVHVLSDGRIGRFGWKAQVPSIREFVRDAVGAELGMTMPVADGLSFGALVDGDDVTDPELNADEADRLFQFMSLLGPPPRQGDINNQDVLLGETLFETIGCESCHVSILPGASGPVAAFSDFLLHDILPTGTLGIEDGDASMTEFRTAPLWGVSQSGPYWHTGEAETIEEAIGLHASEGQSAKDNFLNLSDSDKERVLMFLKTL